MFIPSSPFKHVIEPWPELLAFMRKWFAEFLDRGIPEDVAEPIYGALSYAYANNRGILVTGGDRQQRMYIAHQWSLITRRERAGDRDSRVVPTRFINMLDPFEADLLDRWEWPEDYRQLFNKHIVLAEIGAEEVINHFGVRENPVASFISAYYGGMRGKWSLSYSSHLTEEELKARYTRCFDLIAENADWINLPPPIPVGVPA